MKYLCLLLILLSVSCGIEEILIPRSAKQSYTDHLSEADKFKWAELDKRIMQDSVIVDLPYKESFTLDTTFTQAAGYIVPCSKGTYLHVNLDFDSVFVEVYYIDGDTMSNRRLLYEPDDLKRSHVIEIEETGNYFVTVQPQLNLNTNFALTMFAKPVYLFPVQNGAKRDIGSFWGDPRDGGKRKHKGIDIFANKGTPLLAVTNGRIRSVRNRGLGGKQVWLADSERRQTVYYAHLDSQYVKQGQIVNFGDTIGTVGNTGNARRTPPHLHFGIYASGKGAINPLHYVLPTNTKLLEPISTGYLAGESLMVSINKANLRLSPSSKAEKLIQMNEGQILEMIGIVGKWYHVRIPSGRSGYVYYTSVKSYNEAT